MNIRNHKFLQIKALIFTSLIATNIVSPTMDRYVNPFEITADDCAIGTTKAFVDSAIEFLKSKFKDQKYGLLKKHSLQCAKLLLKDYPLFKYESDEQRTKDVKHHLVRAAADLAPIFLEEEYVNGQAFNSKTISRSLIRTIKNHFYLDDYSKSKINSTSDYTPGSILAVATSDNYMSMLLTMIRIVSGAWTEKDVQKVFEYASDGDFHLIAEKLKESFKFSNLISYALTDLIIYNLLGRGVHALNSNNWSGKNPAANETIYDLFFKPIKLDQIDPKDFRWFSKNIEQGIMKCISFYANPATRVTLKALFDYKRLPFLRELLEGVNIEEEEQS